MNKAIQFTATFLGFYAGVLGIEHGIFELQQGMNPTGGF